ncbi:SMI1/KNR4 family protein [Roseateles asaccharophilus]|uniref:Knr4/Smi1-like domain-containing protein n=1 Tax=Roseateles asaccharophilus TaxID=582607 RepID=A0ABU2AEK2_9BURK|nr:SMI1/KNR4 family protein [Roseateles asaccharophilus]MDR7335405.1 hypothetical protein [Roseateles asaccharophilus]
MKIQNQGPEIDFATIDSLQQSLKAKLPDAYTLFLLQNNGGSPEPNVIDIPGISDSPTDVQVFFGLGSPTSSSDLLWNISLYENKVDEGYVPIGRDSGGNLFLIDIGPGRPGSIFYWDVTGVGDFIRVAENFGDFSEKLRAWV